MPIASRYSCSSFLPLDLRRALIALFLRASGVIALCPVAGRGAIARLRATGLSPRRCDCRAALMLASRASLRASIEWLRLGTFTLSLGFKFDDLAALMLAIVGDRRPLRARVFARLHARRRGEGPLLRRAFDLHVFDDRHRPRRQSFHDVHLLGAGRFQLLAADQPLARAASGGGRGEEGLHHEPRGRLRLPARHHLVLLGARHGQPDRLARRLSSRRWSAAGDSAAAVLRRGRQVGADAAASLVARRDGRPDAGVRADPRGHDGGGRYLHALPDQAF